MPWDQVNNKERIGTLMEKKFNIYDNGHLDTSFEVFENTLKLKKLFGLKMETNTELADRITGIYEIYTSLGAVNGRQVIKDISGGEDSFRVDISLYGGALVYTSQWDYEKGLGIFTRKDWIENQGETEIQIRKALQRYVFSYEEYYAYTQNTRWCYENMGSWQKVSFGGVSLGCEGGRTSQGATPYLALKEKEGNGVVFHIVPNGNWKIDFKTVSLGVSQAGEYGYLLELGQSDQHFNLNLRPGEKFYFPQVIIQKLISGSLTKTADRLQKYFLDHDTDRFQKEHLVAYNPWFEHYAQLEESRLKDHIQAAKELGCEVFEIDAGWFGSQSGDWWAQSGDWAERTDGAFYGRMKAFADYVRGQGLKFGLWMEPERVGEHTPIMKEHPEYFAKGNGHYYPKLYEPKVYDYIYGEITRLVKEYGLAWMKMDFNFEFGEDETESEFYFYYEAWYRMLRQIRKEYPDTFFEACAAGGMRNDIQTATVYDGHFLSDNVNAWDMQATYEQCCLRLPHYRMIKWLVISPGAKISLYDSKDQMKTDTLITTQRPGAGWDEYECISPEFACQLTMAGPMGLSGNFIDITKGQKEVFRSYISFYKEFRNFYKNCTVLLGGEPQNVGDRDGFYHLQYLNQENKQNLVFLYRFATASSSYILYLQDLEEAGDYKISDPVTKETIGHYTGEQLMYRGLELELKTRHSGKILFCDYCEGFN